MIPAEIVVAVIIGLLVLKVAKWYVRAVNAQEKIHALEAENTRLKQDLETLSQVPGESWSQIRSQIRSQPPQQTNKVPDVTRTEITTKRTRRPLVGEDIPHDKPMPDRAT